MLHSHSGILFSNKKKSIDTCKNVDESQMHSTRQKKADSMTRYCMISFVKHFGKGKTIGTEYRQWFPVDNGETGYNRIESPQEKWGMRVG